MKKIFLLTILLTLMQTLSWSQVISPLDPKKYTSEELSMIREAQKIQSQLPNKEKGTPFRTGNLGTGLKIATLKNLAGSSESASTSAKSASAAGTQSAPAASTKDSGSYNWIHPGALGQGENVFNDGNDIVYSLKGKKASDFSAMVSLFKQHGFTLRAEESTFMGMNMYEASDKNHKRCAIILQGNGNMTVSIENDDE